MGNRPGHRPRMWHCLAYGTSPPAVCTQGVVAVLVSQHAAPVVHGCWQPHDISRQLPLRGVDIVAAAGAATV